MTKQDAVLTHRASQIVEQVFLGKSRYFDSRNVDEIMIKFMLCTILMLDMSRDPARFQSPFPVSMVGPSIPTYMCPQHCLILPANS